MKVEANAGFGPTVRGGMGRVQREKTVEQWLRLVGLWGFRSRYPYGLSGGRLQRLAILRALCNDPQLLLMGDTFGALDALTREKMQEELARGLPARPDHGGFHHPQRRRGCQSRHTGSNPWSSLDR